MNYQTRPVRTSQELDSVQVIESRFRINPGTFSQMPEWIHDLTPLPPEFPPGRSRRKPIQGRFFIGTFKRSEIRVDTRPVFRQLAVLGFVPKTIEIESRRWFRDSQHYRVIITHTRRGVNDDPDRDLLIDNCNQLFEHNVFKCVWGVRAWQPESFDSKITLSCNRRAIEIATSTIDVTDKRLRLITR